MSIPWLVNGGAVYLAAAATVLAYIFVLIRRLLSLRRASTPTDKFSDLLFPANRGTSTTTRPHRNRTYFSTVLGCGLIAVLFLLPLSLAWTTGEVQTPYLAIGGRLPWSDASGWLHGLYYMLNEGELTDWTVRRPLHLMYLSSLTLVAGLDLYSLILVRTLMLAAACALLIRELQASFGTAAALVAFAMLLGFSATFTPTMMSEVSGLTFGAGALALLWRGVARDELGSYVLGAALLTLALSVRNGPLLVLGGIVAWPLVGNTAQIGHRLRWVAATGTAIAVCAALAYAWTNALYAGDNMPGANFAFVLYGLAHGGLSWPVFYERFDLEGMSQGAQATLAYTEAFSQIQAHPMVFLEGLWKFTERYFTHSFFYVPNLFRSRITWLFWIGLAVCAWRWRQPQARFLLLVVAGTIASAPIIFFSISAYRAFIVTAPIEAAVVAAAVGTIVAAARGNVRPLADLPRQPEATGMGLLATGLGGLLVATVTVIPLAALGLSGNRTTETPTCAPDLTPAVVELGSDSTHLEIVSDATRGATFGTKIRESDFHTAVTLGETGFRDELLKLRPGQAIVHGYDLSTPRKSPAWIVFNPGQLKGDGLYYVCGVDKPVTQKRHRFVLTFASSVHTD